MSALAVSSGSSPAMTPLLSLSVITTIVVQPSDSGRFVTKSIDISVQIRSGIGRGFRNPCRLVRQDLFATQESQFRVNCLILSPIRGQKYCLASIVYKPSLPGCMWIKESWVAYIRPVRSRFGR